MYVVIYDSCRRYQHTADTSTISKPFRCKEFYTLNHTNIISIPKLKMVTDLVNKSIPALSVRVLVSQEQAKHCLTPWQRLHTVCRHFTVLYLLLNTKLTCPYSVCCSSPCQLLTKPSRSSTHQPVSSISSLDRTSFKAQPGRP